MIFDVNPGFTSILTGYACKLNGLIPEENYNRIVTLAYSWSGLIKLGAHMAVALAWRDRVNFQDLCIPGEALRLIVCSSQKWYSGKKECINKIEMDSKGGVQCVVRRRLLDEVIPGLLPYISEKDIKLSNIIIREAHTSERPPGLIGCNMNIPHFSVERTASRAK